MISRTIILASLSALSLLAAQAAAAQPAVMATPNLTPAGAFFGSLTAPAGRAAAAPKTSAALSPANPARADQQGGAGTSSFALPVNISVPNL